MPVGGHAAGGDLADGGVDGVEKGGGFVGPRHFFAFDA